MHAGATLVVVADGGGARFLSRIRPGARLVELVDNRMRLGSTEPPRDRPFRAHDRMGVGRHAIEERNPREAAEEIFLTEVAERIGDLLRSTEAAQLVLCAPPRALGMLRESLSPDVRERTLSWGKDIIKETPAEIDERLRQLKA